MMAQTIERILLDFRQNTILILDEFDRAGKTLADLKKALARVDIPRGFKHIRTQRSQSDSLIQIADLATGAILHHSTRQDDTGYLKFKAKIQTLLDIPP
ncbi:MAG: hypothetical protein Fur0022_15810 [Anaerolineales bacterium]